MSVQRLGSDFKKAWLTVDRPMRKIYINAYQSHLFNRVLAERIDSLGQLEAGDLAWIHKSGACFLVENEQSEAPNRAPTVRERVSLCHARCEALEISPSGPLFGHKMTPTQGEPGRREARILAEFGSSDSDFQTPDGMVVEGARRPLRVPLGDCQAKPGSDENGEFIELTFFLPAGSYATCVTREICKNLNK